MLRGRSGLVVLLLALAAACSESHVRAPMPERELEPAEASAEPVAVGDCGELVTSNLPGASLRVTTQQCSYSRASLKAGVEIAYEVRFERALRGVRPHQLREEVLAPWPRWTLNFEDACFRPRDKSNLVVAYWIASGGTYLEDLRLWCPDCGGPRCPPITTAAVDVQAGAHRQLTVRWTGDDRLHPAQFPPGDYELTLRADGSFVPDGADEPQLFHMQTTRRIAITP